VTENRREKIAHDIRREKTMTIRVLGPGCINCRTLERRTHEALEQMNLAACVEKVEGLNAIVAYGVMRTPGLVIDEKVVWQGGVPSVEKIKQMISTQRERVGPA
jgi:small redox-active disulfide protein 2